MMDAVQFVSSECGCDESRAKKLLSLCNHDPSKAIKHHRKLQAIYGSQGHSAARAQPLAANPPTPPSENELPTAGSEPDTHRETPSPGPERHVEETKPVAWTFTLPRLPRQKHLDILDRTRDYSGNASPQGTAILGPPTLNLPELCAAVQTGVLFQNIQEYLKSFHDDDVKAQINDTVEGIPSVFYAVEKNDADLLRLWARYGADISAIHPASGTPLLAYAIGLSEQLQGRDTSAVVAVLLGLGASPTAIPDAFYKPYNCDLSEDSLLQHIDGLDPKDVEVEVKAEWQWCQPASIRSLMVRTTHLTNRYYLDRATRLRHVGIRHRQVAAIRNAEGVLGIPHHLIGQTVAAHQLLQKLLSHLTVPSKKPLVLVFAGPSGHGKTELARKLGYLLSLALEVVDCTIFNDERELFGPRAPYHGWERGSPLNNFIANNSGQRSIVFLDEFEKTSTMIHQSLLLPFDNGEYQDRRSLKTINCSRTIWILATNALDDTILQFCSTNPAILRQDSASGGQSEYLKSLSRELAAKLKSSFLNRFGAPITGRVSDFIPFLPFSVGEQAVVAHKFLLDLAERVAAPVVLGPAWRQDTGGTGGVMGDEDHQQLLGNVRLRVSRDASVCTRLANAEYSEELGARSLLKAVSDVQDQLVESYLEEDIEIEENEEQEKMEYVVDVRAGEVVVRKGAGGEADKEPVG